MGAASVNLCIPMPSFELVEKTERQFPHVRSPCLIKEDRYGGWLKFHCFVSKKVVFEQYALLNWKPV